MNVHDRRRFLGRLLGGMAAAAAFPTALSARPKPSFGALRRAADPLFASDPGDERFWHLVKEQFPLRSDLILMNAANLCPSPFPVQRAVFRLTRDVDMDASFQNRAKFGQLREKARAGLAAYLGADPDEIAITRNTSEGNNTVVNGLDLGPSDEVVIWDQNHPTNNIAWDVRAARYGFAVKRVKTPPTPRTAEDLIGPFRDAMSGSTRVVAFSHISNTSGVALPAKAICRLVRDRGAVTLVDGAQSFGAIQVDLHDMGCDFYTGSGHKWFVGPKEAGVLYVRRERAAHLWASDVGVGWQSAVDSGARKFETLGQRDDSAVSAMGTTVDFHNTIGPERSEARVRYLAETLKKGLQDQIPGIQIHTPMEPEFSGGVVVAHPPGMDVPKAYGTLYHEHHIAGAARGGEFPGIRLCPHIYNTMQEVERVVEVMAGMT